MTMIRIQFELPEDKVKELEGLMREANISTRKDLFNNALTLFEWAVSEKKAGNSIASVSEDRENFKELVMPSLSSVVSKKKAIPKVMQNNA
jgi:metal-responsive CopG/Arc/MetJ family transcriptional regulator